MSRPPAAPDELCCIWEQIHRAASLAEALQALTARALVPRGVERAVWVIQVGRELRGVAGVGVDAEAIHALVLPLPVSDPVARSVGSGDRAEIPEGPLGLGRSVVLPLGRWNETEAGSGALILGLARVAEEQVEAIDRLLRSVGPALGQLAELDRLRASSRELDRERSLLTSILNGLPDPVLIADPRANHTQFSSFISDFLASMSHELRTPINALLGYTALMRDGVYGDLAQRQEEALDRMRSASEHLLELVNDILDLARIEAGKMPLDLERVDVAQLVAELGQTIEPMARKKDLRYRVEIEPGIPTLRTDQTKVTQIVLNLLSNAVKFTREGEVSLILRRVPDSPCIEIVVTDTGIGIRPEDLPNIFDDFRQVDQSSTREFGGTGLGLSITKKLLYLLSGTVRVESCVGKGSTFTVRLPIESRDTHRDEDAARVEPGPNC